MSYAFAVQAATKAEVKEKVAAEFDKILSTQPVHGRERASVLAATDAFIDLLEDDEAQDIKAMVSGSVNWKGALEADNAETLPFTQAAVSIGAYLMPRL